MLRAQGCFARKGESSPYLVGSRIKAKSVLSLQTKIS